SPRSSRVLRNRQLQNCGGVRRCLSAAHPPVREVLQREPFQRSLGGAGARASRQHLRNRDALSWIGRRATPEDPATVPRLGQAFQRLFRQMAGDDWKYSSAAFLGCSVVERTLARSSSPSKRQPSARAGRRRTPPPDFSTYFGV